MEARTFDQLTHLFEISGKDQLALCDALEGIADSLPHNVDRQTCIHTAKALGQVIERAHRMEEQEIFPYLETRMASIRDPQATFERLRLEHAGDEFAAEEIIEVLLSYGSGNPTTSSEATGYMLRGFFENLRRHIAFEQELLGAAFIEWRGDEGASGHLTD